MRTTSEADGQQTRTGRRRLLDETVSMAKVSTAGSDTQHAVGLALRDFGLVPESEFVWSLSPQGDMRVPGRIFASEALLPAIAGDRSLEQVRNVAALPGIVVASYAMPDIHWGYGFPIGGVAATDLDEGGVVSPGGVGFDISCGVRLLASSALASDVRPRIRELMAELSRRVPAGHGPGGIWPVDRDQLGRVLREGARAAVAAGYGTVDDLERIEDSGALQVEDAGAVGARARERGAGQLGSLGSGNHFLEVQVVERVLDARVAAGFGLVEGGVTVLVHTGSRGLGHQVCSDHVREILAAERRYRISLPDAQLAAAPVESPHGRRYLAAMAAAANFGRANRQVIGHAVREAFRAVLGGKDGDMALVYDVSHNLARIEEHVIDGRSRRLCVHRKGATLALPAGHRSLPAALRKFGQPVLVPGSMGTASYVLVGEDPGDAFHSTCHGAGRVLGRKQAMRREDGGELLRRLGSAGIRVVARSPRALPEESPEAYKDIEEVVRTCRGAGLSRPVARLVPLGVLKG
jgi:tRNA-splicing ligase RtcB